MHLSCRWHCFGRLWEESPENFKLWPYPRITLFFVESFCHMSIHIVQLVLYCIVGYPTHPPAPTLHSTHQPCHWPPWWSHPSLCAPHGLPYGGSLPKQTPQPLFMNIYVIRGNIGRAASGTHIFKNSFNDDVLFKQRGNLWEVQQVLCGFG